MLQLNATNQSLVSKRLEDVMQHASAQPCAGAHARAPAPVPIPARSRRRVPAPCQANLLQRLFTLARDGAGGQQGPGEMQQKGMRTIAPGIAISPMGIGTWWVRHLLTWDDGCVQHCARSSSSSGISSSSNCVLVPTPPWSRSWGNRFLFSYTEDMDPELQRVFNLAVSQGEQQRFVGWWRTAAHKNKPQSLCGHSHTSPPQTHAGVNLFDTADSYGTGKLNGKVRGGS